MSNKKRLATVLARLREEHLLRDAPRWILELEPSETPTDAQLEELVQWTAQFQVDDDQAAADALKKREAQVLARLRELQQR